MEVNESVSFAEDEIISAINELRKEEILAEQKEVSKTLKKIYYLLVIQFGFFIGHLIFS